jgi:LmbE family N-acetylglucosaminyl deacetylase
MENVVLAVGAHPDDIELGCGGAIVKHIERGDQVNVLIMTNGEKGEHTVDRGECLNSLNVLGLQKENIYFGNYHDGSLSDNIRVVNFVEKIIRKLGVTRIYTHCGNDRHQDHRYCCHAVSAAARKVPEIFLFQGPSTKVPFEPHYFIELSNSQMERKLESLKIYQTQIEKGIVNIKWAKSLAVLHGFTNQTKYAEAFSINHMIRGGDNV